MAEKVLHLVRHGQYEWGGAARGKGPGLTDLGREQAGYTAAALAAEPIRAIHCSTLRRAEETAAIIGERFPDLGLRRSPSLREALPCVPARFAQAESDGLDYAEALTRLRDDADFRVTVERSLASRVGVPVDIFARDRARVAQAFGRYFTGPGRADRHELLVCHGNLIRSFVCRVLHLHEEAWGSMDNYLCGITRIVLRPRGMMYLLSFNDVGHLPPHLRMF